MVIAVRRTGADIIAVGVQECYYKLGDDEDGDQGDLPEGMPYRRSRKDSWHRHKAQIRGNSSPMSKFRSTMHTSNETKAGFEDTISSTIGEGYWLMKSVNLGQMKLMIFVTTAVYPAISRVKSATQATGVANVATNKGGMAISFKYWDTELAFVNCHLAAHLDKVPSRNNMYRNIIRGLRMENAYNMDLLTGYHHVFWMGDLNYRMELGKSTNTPSEEEFSSVVRPRS
eukprot:evm.model.scf_407EXC.3 EVM.evm.TU.scf_407EXC.3   scf_407EXC:38655-42497(+)